MDWFGKSSKAQGKNDMESLGIRFQPIIFHPDHNEYELWIELQGCQKDLVKVTYEKADGKLKVQGQKQKTEFVQEFSVPADCLATGIYGRFRGDVLHIIMPRLLSGKPPSEDTSSKKEDDQKASSDRKAAEHAGEHRDKLPARAPSPPPSDQRSTYGVKEGGEVQWGSRDKKLPAKRKWLASEDASAEKEDDQKASSDGKAMAEAGEYREKLPARVPAPSPFDSETLEKSRQRDNELFPEISASRPSAIEPSRSVKELRENYQRNLSKIAAPPPPPPPPPFGASSRTAATTPWNRKTTGIRARKEEEKDQTPPSMVVTASPSSDQKKTEQGGAESEKSVLKSQKSEKKSDQEDTNNAKIVRESKEKEESEEKKPSADGNVLSGVVAKLKETGKAAVAKVKETGKAVVAVVTKEENRPAVMVGAAVLIIVVIGAARKKTKN